VYENRIIIIIIIIESMELVFDVNIITGLIFHKYLSIRRCNS